MRATNRAILCLQDMPEHCIKCPCYNIDIEECQMCEEDVTVNEALKGERPEWCPLEYVDADKPEKEEKHPEYNYDRAIEHINEIFGGIKI